MARRATTLAAAVLVVLGASALRADQIDEISADSLDTTFDYVANPLSDSELKIAQDGVTVVVEKPGNVQEEVSGALFSLMTNLSADNSVGGKALASFEGGSLLIEDAFGVTLLAGEVRNLSMEEDTALPYISVMTGSGSFDVTGGVWADSFGPWGTIFDLTWTVGTDVNDFSSDFSAESDVTLTPVPEPTVLSLLAVGGAALLRRRKR